MLIITAVALLQIEVATPGNHARAEREARKAQARFETVRRAHLPWERSGGSASNCDAVIGRFCYWYDSTDAAPAPEPPQITEARTRLLRALEWAAREDSSDPWLTGQRIRYLLEARRTSEAVDVARACRAERWRCAAFEGLALHVAERYPEADSVFEVALGAMSGEQRCQWTDVRALGLPAIGTELSRTDCVGRRALADRLWELSRPLWSVPGNDLRTEHYARLTMSEILENSSNAHGMVWSGDSRQLLVRYGWAEWFTRSGGDIAGLYTAPRVTGHDREPSYFFFPSVASVRGLAGVTDSVWSLRHPLAPTRYAPRYIKRLTSLPHQLARFPRGDSMIVAVRYRITDAKLGADSVGSWIAVSDTENFVARTLAHGARWDSAKATGSMLATLPSQPLVVSLETRGGATMHAARARYTLEPLACSQGWCLSDLVLSEAPFDGVESIAAAAELASPELLFANRSALGVFWEVQRPPGNPPLASVTLTVSPTRVSVGRRMLTRLRLAPELAPVRLQWQSAVVSARETNHVTLRLPPSARGQYRVLLRVEAPTGESLTAERIVEFRP